MHFKLTVLFKNLRYSLKIHLARTPNPDFLHFTLWQYSNTKKRGSPNSLKWISDLAKSKSKSRI